MLKFKITPERFSEACGIIEYIGVSNGNKEMAIRVAPRFLLDDKGEYVVQVKLDDDGDIASLDGGTEALLQMSVVTPKRLERLSNELVEAAKAIVNPPNGTG